MPSYFVECGDVVRVLSTDPRVYLHGVRVHVTARAFGLLDPGAGVLSGFIVDCNGFALYQNSLVEVKMRDVECPS